MNKLKLFISVGICGILFTGCGFIAELFGKSSSKSKTTSSSSTATTRQVERGSNCVPADLMDRLVTYSSTGYTIYTKGYDEFFGWYSSKTICNDFMIDSYNEVIKQTKQLPTNIDEEQKLSKEWAYCNIMPKWLESKLNEYIEQNKNSDAEYVNASKFKESWQDKFSAGHSMYMPNEGLAVVAERRTRELQGKNAKDVTLGITDCFAYKGAIKAIENDLIDLGGGKKAKCADLSWKDAKKCLDYFDSAYDKTYKTKEKEVVAKIKAIRLKQERESYEKKNKKQFVESALILWVNLWDQGELSAIRRI